MNRHLFTSILIRAGAWACACVWLSGNIALASSAPAADAAAPAKATSPVITVRREVEEGKPVLRADVTLGGKPLKGAKVEFAIRRTFGNLVLGEDQTEDDGSAVVPFPADLPVDAEGHLTAVARLTAPPEVKGAQGYGTVDDGAVKKESPGNRSAVVASAEHALWSRHAPLTLLAIIIVIVGGVWSAYAYAVFQVLKIGTQKTRKGA